MSSAIASGMDYENREYKSCYILEINTCQIYCMPNLLNFVIFDNSDLKEHTS